MLYLQTFKDDIDATKPCDLFCAIIILKIGCLKHIE